MAVARRIIVGASGSPGSVRAMRHARDLAATRGDTVLVVAHAWTLPGGDFAEQRSPAPSLGEVWRNVAWKHIVDCVAAAWGGLPSDVPTSLVVARGPAGQVLVALADRGDDLLVVGTGRRGRLARIGHGKVARYTLGHAKCPVLGIPPASLERYARHGLRNVFRYHGLSADEAASAGR